MIFLLLLLIHCEDKELELFLNKDIKIFFSGYPTTFLGVDDNGSELIAHNKYVNFDKLKFNPKSRIIKEGKNFELYFSGNKFCKEGHLIRKCNTSGGWSLNRKYFGYSISKDDLCITKDIDDTLKMKKCVDTDDQLFSFKLVASDCDPEEKMSDHHSVHVNLIQDGVKKYSIKHIKNSEVNDGRVEDEKLCDEKVQDEKLNDEKLINDKIPDKKLEDKLSDKLLNDHLINDDFLMEK